MENKAKNMFMETKNRKRGGGGTGRRRSQKHSGVLDNVKDKPRENCLDNARWCKENKFKNTEL